MGKTRMFTNVNFSKIAASAYRSPRNDRATLDWWGKPPPYGWKATKPRNDRVALSKCNFITSYRYILLPNVSYLKQVDT
jgi:hypothetical protein